MILGYACKKTEAFARGEFVAAFQGFEDQAAKRLATLNAAGSLQDLRAIRSNRQWCICFIWFEAKGPTNVEIVDYH
ncbi:MAG: plasmid maintenance system killer protein [bacterium]|nr:plasmid maintenance system killer protein [bacterium]